MKTYSVNKQDEGQTLEKYVKKVLSNAPLGFIYKLFRKKDIRINNHWEDKKAIVHDGDIVSIYITDAQFEEFNQIKVVEPSLELEPMIVYEDENVLIVNKPRGLLVQKDKPNSKALDDMVIAYLLAKKEYLPSETFTPGPAHRIDRNTAGLVIFGKNIATLQYLMELIKDKEEIGKHYIALVKGTVETDGVVDAPLKKNEETSLVKVTSKKDGGKPAKTIYHVIKTIKDYSLLDITLVTGRTHQIRVHMAYINHPVIGDNKYGDFALNKYFEKEFGFKNQFLVASRLDFGSLRYPLSSLSKQKIEIPLPKELDEILSKI